MEMIDFLRLHPSAFLISAALLGALVGSFLNVVIYRFPIMLKRDWQSQCYTFLNEFEPDSGLKANPPQHERFNLVVPRSHCPSCKHPVGVIENIPIISFLVLRGRCRHCGTAISWRYPIVELSSALLTLIAAYHGHVSVHFIMLAVLSWGLIALTLIDYDHQLLPDNIVLPLLWLVLLYSPLNPDVTPQQSIIGAAVGYLILWSVATGYQMLTGKHAMGNGDFKLLAIFGAWLGWSILPLIIILSSFVGALVGVGLVIFKGRDRNKPIPFGPYLAAAGLIAVYWGDSIVSRYLHYAAYKG